jgi:hypothetical protein
LVSFLPLVGEPIGKFRITRVKFFNPRLSAFIRVLIFCFGERKMPEIKHAELTQRIIGAFYAVYNCPGYGFLEKVYENALALELRKSGLYVEQQKPSACIMIACRRVFRGYSGR